MYAIGLDGALGPNPALEEKPTGLEISLDIMGTGEELLAAGELAALYGLEIGELIPRVSQMWKMFSCRSGWLGLPVAIN